MNYPPYSYIENGTPKGVYVDIIKTAFEQIKEKDNKEIRNYLTIDDKVKNNLFQKLNESIKSNRPKNIKVIINEIENYILRGEDKDIFLRVKEYVSLYQFKNAIELIESSILEDI